MNRKNQTAYEIIDTPPNCPVFSPVQLERLEVAHAVAWKSKERLSVKEGHAGPVLQGVLVARCGSQVRDLLVLWSVDECLSRVHYRRMREAASRIEALNSTVENEQRREETHRKALRRMARMEQRGQHD